MRAAPTYLRLAGALALAALLSAHALALRVVKDETGRTVRLPDQVHRVVCLTPSVVDTVYALGAGELVAGVTDYTVYPPEARKKPSIGEVLRPSLERIAALHPDVVIGVAPLNSAETIHGVEQMGIPLFLVNATGIEGLYRSIASIGLALGREREATALVARLRERETRVRTEAARRRHPSVFFVLSIDPCITAGRRAFITELLEAAGARSVTGDLPQEWVNVNIEAMLPRRPEFILLLKDSPFGVNDMREHAGWRSFEAVHTGRVLRIDDRLQYPSPVAIDALEEFSRQLDAALR
jgi:iron complex transport system substrate-binding protein